MQKIVRQIAEEIRITEQQVKAAIELLMDHVEAPQFSRYLLRDSPKVLSGCAILVWLRAIVCLVGACRVLRNFYT